MRPALAAGLFVFALSLFTAGARAADQPATRPSRDVDVTYRITGPAGAAQQRVRWEAATGRERIDPPTPGLHVIVDTSGHRVDSVRDAERIVLEVPMQDTDAPAPDAAAYVRRGTATVAGLACTVWHAGPAADAPDICFTDDGVLLQVANAGKVVAEAVHVAYTPSNPADFVVPPDYRRVGPGQPAPQGARP